MTAATWRCIPDEIMKNDPEKRHSLHYRNEATCDWFEWSGTNTGLVAENKGQEGRREALRPEKVPH